jgi:non-hemolytic enterotoxin B/C
MNNQLNTLAQTMDVPTQTPSTTSSTQNIKSAAATVIGANALIQTYINTIMGTPNIDLSSIPFTAANAHVVADLPAHQVTARSNAESYFSGATSINAQIVCTLSDIIGFANLFESRYQRLLTLAGPDGNPQGQDLITFNEGLQGLINNITVKENNCVTIVNALTAFTTLIQADERNFQADEDIIKATLDGDNGAIKNLQDAIGAINTAINKDNAMIAGGAAMEIGGILMIVVGVAGEIESAGASTALVVGGLAVIGGGVAMQVLAGKDLSAKMTQLQNDNVQLATDLQISACLINASKNVTAIITSIANAIIAIQNLQAGWSGLKGDLQQIIDALNAGTGDEGTTWLITDLNAAYADWNSALALAVQLQSNGTLQIQNSNPVNYPTPA